MSNLTRSAVLLRMPVLIVGACVGITSCASIAEKAAEEGLERAIEADSGEDVEFNFDNDGGFKVETEDGSFEIDDDGNFTITDADGSLARGSVDQSGETITVGVEGEQTFRTLNELPDNWPSDVPEPTNVDVEYGTFMDTDEGQFVNVGGALDGDEPDFVESYSARLEAAGFERTGLLESPDSTTAMYVDASWSVTVAAYQEGAGQAFSISLFPSDNP